VFNVDDRILVKILYKFKGYGVKNSKIPDKSWNVNGLNYLLKKLTDTDTTARQPGSGRRQSVHTDEKVDTVNDLVLSHKGVVTCIKPNVKLQGRLVFITIQGTTLLLKFITSLEQFYNCYIWFFSYRY